MNTALTEASIGWVHKNYHLVMVIFLVREISNFVIAGRNSLPIYRVSLNPIRTAKPKP